VQPEQDLRFLTIRREQERIHGLIRHLDDRIEDLASTFRAPEAGEAARAEVEEMSVRCDRNAAVSPEESRPAPPPTSSEVEALSRAERPYSSLRIPQPAMSASAPEEPEPANIAAPQEDSLEIAFGRVWLVRIGIVVLLTGLALLGNLAYQQIIPRLGPAAKLVLIYLAGGALVGIGSVLERKRESLRNYARVLMAGGCATIYFATYAAHFVSGLRVIESPLLAGTLLLGVALGIGIAAVRRQSEPLAGVCLLLSYYTAGLNPIGSFTLFSSALLAGLATFLLVRYRWVKITTFSILGAYLSYAWCRLGGSMGHGTGAPWVLAFLAGYWLIFTGGILGAGRGVLGKATRATLLTLNNGAFFSLGALEVMLRQSADLWLFAVVFGAVLLGCAVLARLRDPEDTTFDGAYLTQGLVLLSLGCAIKLEGRFFALMLAAQSVVLLTVRGRHEFLRSIAGYLSAAGAVGLSVAVYDFNASGALPTAMGVMVAMLVNALVAVRRNPESDWQLPVVGFSGAALILACTVLKFELPNAWQPAAFAGVALALALLSPRLRLSALQFGGQAFLPVGAAIWALEMIEGRPGFGWTPGFLVAAGFLLAVYFNRRVSPPSIRAILEFAGAGVASLVASVWLVKRFPGEWMFVASAAEGSLWIFAGLLVRNRAWAVAAIPFAALVTVGFVQHQANVAWWIALVPIAHFLLAAEATRFAARLGDELEDVAHGVRSGCHAIAGILSLIWAFTHIPADWQALFFVTAGVITATAGAMKKRWSWHMAGFVGGVLGWFVAVVFREANPTWQHLLAFAVFGAGFRGIRAVTQVELSGDLKSFTTWLTMSGFCLWFWRWSELPGNEMSQTILCTLLGLVFAVLGLVLHDRVYRIGGLGLLVLAVGRVFLWDVWRMDPGFRILSFILLGVVLLLVGYFYNRFAEQLRRWL
jgi:uncharacterized membrane protein